MKTTSASPPLRALTGRVSASLCALILVSCAATNPYQVLIEEQVPASLAQITTDLEAERGREALLQLQRIWEVPDLDPSLLIQAEELLQRAAPLAASSEIDGEQLLTLAGFELPRRTRIELWVAGARALLSAGERVDAFKAVRDLEDLYPMHFLRRDAGDLVIEAGLSLAADEGRHHLLFAYKEEAPPVLEYFTVTFPSNPRCDEAYFVLAGLYEEEGQWAEAIRRHRDLLLFHPESSFATYSEARVPLLRTREVQSTEYDRNAMIQAEFECEDWLQRHPQHELEGSLQELVNEIRKRLVLHDLHVAEFYREVENGFGARHHSQRALELAQQLGESALVDRCQALLTQASALPSDGGPDSVLGTGSSLAEDGFGITGDLPAPQPPDRAERDTEIRP